jgi:cytidylate kinase
MPVRPEHLDAETQALAARDHADSSREIAPLRPAADAVHLDTTKMDFAEQVRFIVDRARPIFAKDVS